MKIDNILPFKVHHKSFGEIEILGIRIKCSSNNNTMYMFEDSDGDYLWVYDYETYEVK